MHMCLLIYYKSNSLLALIKLKDEVVILILCHTSITIISKAKTLKTGVLST